MKAASSKWIWPLIILSLTFLAGCGNREKLIYRVAGLAAEAQVEYKGPEGEMVEEEVRLPWSLEMEAGSNATFELYALNTSGFGTVTCEVSLGERSMGEASGMVFAGCSGAVEKAGGEVSIHFKGFDDVAPDSRTLPAPGRLVPGNELIVARGGNVLDGLDLYLIDPSSGAMTKWTDGLFSVFCPQWSLDGERVAFLKKDLHWDVFVMNVDGTGLLRLTNNEAREGCPAWSPDGNSLVFDSQSGYNLWDMILASSDGTSQALLSGTLRLSQPDANFFTPNWSPDGTRIAFTLNVSRNNDIYLLDVESGEANPLEVTADQNEAFPRWSPDNQHILFFREDGLYIADADGGGSLKLDTGSLDVESVDWSPDGTRIIFGAREKSEEGAILAVSLYLINADGTGLLKFAELAGTDLTDPDWRSFAPDALMLNLPTLPVIPKY